VTGKRSGNDSSDAICSGLLVTRRIRSRRIPPDTPQCGDRANDVAPQQGVGDDSMDKDRGPALLDVEETDRA